MRFNHFDSTIFGNQIWGQGFTNAVEGSHRATLRILVAKLVAPPLLASCQLACATAYAGGDDVADDRHGDVSKLFGTLPARFARRRRRDARHSRRLLIWPRSLR